MEVLLQKETPKSHPTSTRSVRRNAKKNATHHFLRFRFPRHRPQPRWPHGHNYGSRELRSKEGSHRSGKLCRYLVLENLQQDVDTFCRPNPSQWAHIRILGWKSPHQRVYRPPHNAWRGKTNHNNSHLLSSHRRPHILQRLPWAPIHQCARCHRIHPTPRHEVSIPARRHHHSTWWSTRGQRMLHG